jgi:hypothetical protein
MKIHWCLTIKSLFIAKAVLAKGEKKADMVKHREGIQSRRLTLQPAPRRTGVPFI